MIDIKSIEKDWVEGISKRKKADKILIEKVIRALMLLEGLSNSGLDFVFKGGNSSYAVVRYNQTSIYRH